MVGLIPAECEFRLDPAETVAVASVPIRALMERGNFTLDDRLSPGGHSNYHFYVNGWDVWGVTDGHHGAVILLVYGFEIKKIS